MSANEVQLVIARGDSREAMHLSHKTIGHRDGQLSFELTVCLRNDDHTFRVPDFPLNCWVRLLGSYDGSGAVWQMEGVAKRQPGVGGDWLLRELSWRDSSLEKPFAGVYNTELRQGTLTLTI